MDHTDYSHPKTTCLGHVPNPQTRSAINPEYLLIIINNDFQQNGYKLQRGRSITRAEEIEHSYVSVEQQALLDRQSATAKVGNEVREKNSVSEVPRTKKNKGKLDKGGE